MPRGTQLEVATIPFAFQAQGRLLPAGEYRVQQINYNGIFQLSNAQGGSTFVSAPLHDTGAAENPRLTFHCYGNERLLAQISTVDGTSYSTGDTSHEKELRRHLEMSPLISIKLNSR